MIIIFFIRLSYFVMSRFGRQISLYSNNRFYPCFFTFLIKLNHTIHNPVVANSHGRRTFFFCSSNKLINFSKPVKQRIVSMIMEVNEIHEVICYALYYYNTEEKTAWQIEDSA